MPVVFSLSFEFYFGLAILLLALGLDLVGEPPEKVHPTVWMGAVIAELVKVLRRVPFLSEKTRGAILALVLVFGFSLITYFVLDVIRISLGLIALVVASAILLKTTFALQTLKRFAEPIAQSLENQDLESARKDLQKIVGRKTQGLDEAHVVSGAVESVAEGIVDGITSPLFYYALLGVPGSVGFRAINTLDSMVAYRTEEFLDLGWMSAKLDTLANYIPARLSALLIVVSSFMLGEDWKGSLRILRRDHGRTASVNAGWPMSAMAGALNIQLEKVGNYALGDNIGNRSFDHVRRSIRIAKVSSYFFIAAILLPLLAVTSSFLKFW